MGLDWAGLAAAMGIAGTMASGSLEYLSDGAWTKRLNAGWAAHSGIVAAQLAAAGFTGPASALDGPLGVLRAYTDAPEPARLLDSLGDGFEIMAVAIKPYACCRYNHGLIDAVRAIRADERFALDRVRRIRLGVLSAGALLVAEPIERKRNPRSVVDAQFSAPFAAAVGLIFDAAGPEQFQAGVIDDARVRHLMSRTDCFASPTLDDEYPTRWPARAEIELDDGLVLTSDIPFARGEPENPVSRVELLDKFLGLTAPFGVDASLGERILAFDRQPSIANLLDSLPVSRSSAMAGAGPIDEGQATPGPERSRGDGESAILR
jgi:2-methylcitrate dehydratase PrpD